MRQTSPRRSLPVLALPRLRCLALRAFPSRSAPCLRCLASPVCASPYLDKPLRALPALMRQTSPHRALPVLALPRLACLASPRPNNPRRALPRLPCYTAPLRSNPCQNIPGHACLAGPGHTVLVRAPPRLRRLVDTKLGFNCFLAVALHYLEQAKPTASACFAVWPACSNPYL